MYTNLMPRQLSEAELRMNAPSIFAGEAHESRSERYTYIPTIDVVRAMQEEGFYPVQAVQCRTRDASKRAFTKHMVRFRHATARLNNVGDTLPEIVLVNSHDGSSAYKAMSGLFRLVCSNGMVIADNQYSSVSVPHKGNVLDNVIEGSYQVLREAKNATERADEWATIALNREEQHLFAEAAHMVRFGEESPIQADQLLLPRRLEDRKDDLWTTFNRVQENSTKGGLSARNERGRRVRTRQVKGIDQDTKLNQALWMIGERFAEMKRG